MNDINKLKEQQREKHPGFDKYLECMSRALFSGVATFGLGFSSTYFLQKLLGNKLPFAQKARIFNSFLVATISAYYVTSVRTKSCQAAWMAAENKHTALE